jgi:hypothetical protein
MLEVLTPAASVLLTILDAVKADLGILTTDTSKDVVLNDLIRDASDEIQREYQFLCRQTYRETLPGYGNNILQLKRTPIVSVSSVTHNSEPIIDYTIEDKDAGHLYRKLGWCWTASVGWKMTGYVIPNSEHPDFTVDYVAGYLAADQANSDMPPEVQRSARETVIDWFKSAGRAADIQSKSVGDLSITYVTGDAAKFSIPPRALTRLQKWKRLV